MKIFSVKFNVRSYECDSYGHVNNAVYLNYLEYARMTTLSEHGFTLDKMKQKGYLVVIRRIKIDYISPLYMGQEILIKTFTSESKNTSGTFTQQIFSVKDNKIAAEAKVTWVFTNFKGRPIPIPEEIRETFGINKS